MKIIPASFKIWKFDMDDLYCIEQAGRTCYKSEKDITEGSADKFIKEKLIPSGHESVLEHSRLTIFFTVDRGISHELVRHRLAAFSQESTRYCNYSKDKFGREITVIEPCFYRDIPEQTKLGIQDVLEGRTFKVLNEPSVTKEMRRYLNWYEACQFAERRYFDMLDAGAKPQEARSVLPNSLKTEIWMTTNFREWRHILELRTAINAHPQMREIMVPLLTELQNKLPSVFGDIVNPASVEP